MVDNAVTMIRWRIKRVEFQWDSAGIDDVVIRPCRDDHRETRSDRRPNAVENCLTGSGLHAKELVQLVNFRADLFLGLQGHYNELAVLRRVKHPTELFVLDRETLDVLHKAFHGSPFVNLTRITVISPVADCCRERQAGVSGLSSRSSSRRA